MMMMKKKKWKEEEKDKRLEGKSRGKHQESDTMHSAPSDKEENPREGSNNEGNGTSDEECVVTFNFSGNGEREEGSAEVSPKEVEEEEEPKQSEAQTTDWNSGCVNVLEESTQNNTGTINSGGGLTVVAAAALMAQESR